MVESIMLLAVLISCGCGRQHLQDTEAAPCRPSSVSAGFSAILSCGLREMGSRPWLLKWSHRTWAGRVLHGRRRCVGPCELLWMEVSVLWAHSAWMACLVLDLLCTASAEVDIPRLMRVCAENQILRSLPQLCSLGTTTYFVVFSPVQNF